MSASHISAMGELYGQRAGSSAFEFADAIMRASLAAQVSQPAMTDEQIDAATVRALRMIAWSNDSAWQAQCAREVLEARGIAIPAAPKEQ